MLWFLFMLFLLVILIGILVSKKHRRTWSVIGLFTAAYELALPFIGNSNFVRDYEMAYDINHFQYTVTPTTPNPLSNYAAEKTIITAPHPVQYKLISTSPYVDGIKSTPDMFLATISFDNKEYDLTFTDPLEPLTWSPFRMYSLSSINPVS